MIYTAFATDHLMAIKGYAMDTFLEQ